MWKVPMLTFIRIFGSAALCGAAAYACTLLPLSNLLRLALAIAAGGAVYVLCLLISGEAREEAAQLTKKLRRR